MVKVYLKNLSSNASSLDKEIAFKKMFSTFKKLVVDAGILQEYKKREFYESPGEKRRRKKKEQRNQVLKSKLRENFPERYGE
jgi:small subunit ribosomal protein S21